MSQKDCIYFSGYKPCGKSTGCHQSCDYYKKSDSNVLVVGLGAMGSVLRATSLLPKIRKRHSSSQIHWLTEKISLPLLENNPFLQNAYGLDFESLLKLEGLQFDCVYVLDKDHRIGGILSRLSYNMLKGFKLCPRTNSIVPATSAAEELWSIGLSNQKKFFENKKPETQLLTEALGLGPWEQDEYILELTDSERELVRQRRLQWKDNRKFILGINTGCSPTIAAKKLSVAGHRRIIEILEKYQLPVSVVLLGGPGEGPRNTEIGLGFNVIQSPTDLGTRDGICSVAACDLVLSGDSLGMHMAIALKKWVVAWFGPTCAHEIDLYHRGTSVLASVECSPCWKRSCDKVDMCYDQVEPEVIIDGIIEGIRCLQPSYKQPSLEIFF